MSTRSTLLFCMLILMACNRSPENTAKNELIKGWNILSNVDSIAEMAIERSSLYDINHLQISHHNIMDLNRVKDPWVAKRINRMAEIAHSQGIEEVTVWDHALYKPDYYPDEFKTGPGGLINLDNPEFWSWIKKDYREMLELAPEIDGLILTFIETGAHVEDQYSEILNTEEEKLAAMIDTLSSVIIDEYNKSLYIRTFIYTRAELSSLLKAIALVKNPKITVMTKETPHDFFLTHPVSSFVGDIEAPVIIEFDCGHEYNGQSILSSIFPELHAARWEYYSQLPNVKGYVIRTDRYKNATTIGNPAEINLFALKKASENKTGFSMEEVYDEFISENYGPECVQYLKPAFKLAPDIILSSLYTLGLALNSHSRLDIENSSAYQRHVSGKWLNNQYIKLERGNDTTLHYWKDIVNHLAPVWNKGQRSHQLSRESQWVLDSNWISEVDEMNPLYLDLIVREKEYAVLKAEEALELVKKAAPCAIDTNRYNTCLHVFERTLLTARLHREVSTAYFSYRVYSRGKDFQTEELRATLEQSIDALPPLISAFLDYPNNDLEGQYNWKEDAYRAMSYYLNFKAMKGDFNTPYTRDTFDDFPYSGLSEEKKDQLFQ